MLIDLINILRPSVCPSVRSFVRSFIHFISVNGKPKGNLLITLYIVKTNFSESILSVYFVQITKKFNCIANKYCNVTVSP